METETTETTDNTVWTVVTYAAAGALLLGATSKLVKFVKSKRVKADKPSTDETEK